MLRNPPLCILLLACATALAAPQATPGQWETTSKVTMSGMNHDIPPVTVKMCLKPSDVKDVQKQLSSGPHGQANKDCKMVDNTISGDTVTFHMQCTGQHKSDIRGTVTYGKDSYQGSTQIDATGPNGTMHMTNQFTAKRIGDC
ncbi:MAG: DUF3617 family protein [Burkholderiales bacterium]|nr:DUF3617 family protein [Burkholderiales bacterium]